MSKCTRFNIVFVAWMLTLAASVLTLAACGDDDATIKAQPVVYTLNVPIDYNDPSGPSITVEFAIQKASQASQGQILWLTGGPGGNVFDFDNTVYRNAGSLNQNYDYVFFNIRGVGDQATTISCPSNATDLPDCFTKLNALIPLRTITTRNVARDLHTLCEHIGCKKWKAMYGQSFGTRVIQEYLRLYPGEVERFVMDGTDSPMRSISQLGPDLNKSFAKLVSDCQGSSTCTALIKPNACTPGQCNDLNDVLTEVLKRADAGTLTLPQCFLFGADDPMATFTISGARIISLLELLLRDTSTRPTVPQFLTQALDTCQLTCGATSTCRATFVNTVSFSTSGDSFFGRFNGFLNQTMRCVEDFRFERMTDFTKVKADGGVFKDSGIEDFYNACKNVFDTLVPDNEADVVHEYVMSDAKGCVLNGIDDPVTPIDGAEGVAMNLPNAEKFFLPYHGHVVIDTECGSSLVSQCINPNSSIINSSCIQTITPPYYYNPINNNAVVASLSSTLKASDYRSYQLLKKLSDPKY